MPPSFFFVPISQFEENLARNPSRPPFFKGRRASTFLSILDSVFSPFEKGGLRGI
jgi:hypothetical protein